MVLEAGATSEAADSARFLDPPGTIEAGFLQRSYAPGATAELVIQTAARGLALQVMHAGREPHEGRTRGWAACRWAAAGPSRWHGGRGMLQVGVESWQTGLHFV